MESPPTESPKRGRGRPRTMPEGGTVRLRLDVTPAEADVVREAYQAAGLTQRQFTRRAVVSVARAVKAGKPFPELTPETPAAYPEMPGNFDSGTEAGTAGRTPRKDKKRKAK